jgi:3-hydroxyacyl-[acyl-carrier-protein] dehydratase
MSTTILQEEIQLLIPHRFPMLLVDKVVDVVLDEKATGIKNVTINEWFFQGHFPEKPVMPGVLIVEAMAQTAGILVMKTTRQEAKGKIVYFMSIEKARFRKPVVPGDTVKLLVEKQRYRSNVWKFSGTATVDGQVVAEAVFSAMITDSK